MLERQHCGIEIEFTGIKRERAAKVIAKALGGDIDHLCDGYDTYEVRDRDGKNWKVMYDSSIRAEYWRLRDVRYVVYATNPYSGNYANQGAGLYKCELVTPVLGLGDLGKLEKILKALGKTRAKVNERCGLHVHCDGFEHKVGSIKNLVGMMVNKEELLYQALQVRDSGVNDFAKKIFNDRCYHKFYEAILSEKYRDLVEVGQVYYACHDHTWAERNRHYSDSRYFGLNLHSLWQKGTVEFRLFNSTLNFEEVKAYAVLAMALNEKSLDGKGMSLKQGSAKAARENMVWWLERLGLRGREWAGVRKVLSANLPRLAEIA